MDFSLLIQRFAEQSPLIIGCGIAIWQLQKMYKEEKQLLRTERLERQEEIKELIKSYNAEIKEINDKHTAELKELNKYSARS